MPSSEEQHEVEARQGLLAPEKSVTPSFDWEHTTKAGREYHAEFAEEYHGA